MVKVQVKICGLSGQDSLQTAITDGADFLGFVSFEKSPRHLSPPHMGVLIQHARLLSERLGRRVQSVAVVVDPSDDDLETLVTTARPDLIQLHGKESLARVAEIARRTQTPLIKACSIAEKADVVSALSYEPLVQHLLFDAKPPKDAALPGGVGARFDWTLMAGIKTLRPWFLAGGLDPWNAAEAVKVSGAPALDVSSGVERAPGLKDPALISAFLKAVA